MERGSPGCPGRPIYPRAAARGVRGALGVRFTHALRPGESGVTWASDLPARCGQPSGVGIGGELGVRIPRGAVGCRVWGFGVSWAPGFPTQFEPEGRGRRVWRFAVRRTPEFATQGGRSPIVAICGALGRPMPPHGAARCGIGGAWVSGPHAVRPGVACRGFGVSWAPEFATLCGWKPSVANCCERDAGPAVQQAGGRVHDEPVVPTDGARSVGPSARYGIKAAAVPPGVVARLKYGTDLARRDRRALFDQWEQFDRAGSIFRLELP
jgi:hypothetical protein